MLNPTFEKAYEIDEGLRWREVINRYFVRQRIIEKKDMEDWAKKKDYDRPLKFMGKEKVPFIKRVVNFLRMFIP